MTDLNHEAVYKECIDYFYNCSMVFYGATKEKLKGKDKELFVVMASCLNTAQGVHRLASINQTENEAIMLMRALLERLINYNYLRKTDKKEYERYWSYPYYRMYHNAKQAAHGNEGHISVKLDSTARKAFRNHPKVKHALSIFSEKDSRLSWTKKTFNERMKDVTKTSALSESVVLINSILTYRSASESLHGSLYGLMQLTGLFEINNNFDVRKLEKEKVRSNIERGLGLRLTLLGYLMADTSHSIAVDYANDLLEKDSDKLRGDMTNILIKIEKLK